MADSYNAQGKLTPFMLQFGHDHVILLKKKCTALQIRVKTTHQFQNLLLTK